MTPADQRLSAALAAEHAAIYGYGAVGARLDAGTVGEVAQAAEAAHRVRRDALVVRLASKGVSVPQPDPTYTLPFPIIDRGAALRLAIAIEERTAAIWRLALADTDGIERLLALDALVDCATRAARARRYAGAVPLTVAFPGRDT